MFVVVRDKCGTISCYAAGLPSCIAFSILKKRKMIEISNYKILPNVHMFIDFSNSSKPENKIEFWRFYILK
jgi:hypothetical protein